MVVPESPLLLIPESLLLLERSGRHDHDEHDGHDRHLPQDTNNRTTITTTNEAANFPENMAQTFRNYQMGRRVPADRWTDVSLPIDGQT